MPEEGIHFLPKEQLLSYEEMIRVTDLFGEMGVDKIRITASGILAASVIAGGMYIYAQTTKERDEPSDEPND